MDLIYMNSDKEDIGVLKDYTFDLAFGSSENDFECVVSAKNNVCKPGFFLYYEGSEYGGIIDSVYVDTESENIKYLGRTWHGIIASKIIQPDANQDYLILNGEANAVIDSLLSRMGLSSLFKVSNDESGINISNYKMNRYIEGYEGIRKMLSKFGGKLDVKFKEGFVELSAKPLVDYSKDEQFDTDQISFTIQKNSKHVNHVICLGQGDLKDRRVIHVYADLFGNISGTQTQFGLDEVCVAYDNSNAESDDELKQGGFDIITESFANDSIDFDFNSNDESFDINDVIGAKELNTGTVVSASIKKKIVKIVNNKTTISYECEGTSGTISSGSYPSSGTGGGGSQGPQGDRGTGIYSISSAPSAYTTQIGSFSPSYRIALDTVLSQSGVSEVFVGDQLRYSYYLYPVGYVDSSYVYLASRVSIRGATGQQGISVKSITTLYYCKSNTIKPSKPTEKVTQTGDVKDAWSLTPATWTETYKYYYTCSQIEYSNGTYSWSDVVQDNSLSKSDGSLKSTYVGHATGTSSAYSSIDISSIPDDTMMRIEVRIPIDNAASQTTAWFSTTVKKSSSTADYLYNCGGYYYSANYNASVFINVSNSRVTINDAWTKVIGGSNAAAVNNLKSKSIIYVYTENL